MLMEYPGEGFDLRQYNKLQSSMDDEATEESFLPIDEPTIKKIMRMLLEGVTFLHSKGVCHRDIKPSNIYISKDLNTLKILDFNVALRF